MDIKKTKDSLCKELAKELTNYISTFTEEEKTDHFIELPESMKIIMGQLYDITICYSNLDEHTKRHYKSYEEYRKVSVDSTRIFLTKGDATIVPYGAFFSEKEKQNYIVSNKLREERRKLYYNIS